MAWLINNIALSSPLIKLMMLKTATVFVGVIEGNNSFFFSSLFKSVCDWILFNCHWHSSNCEFSGDADVLAPRPAVTRCLPARPGPTPGEHVFRPLHSVLMLSGALLSDQFRPEQASAHRLWVACRSRHLCVCVYGWRKSCGRRSHTRSHWVCTFPTRHGWKSKCVWMDSLCARSAMPAEPLKFPLNGNKRDTERERERATPGPSLPSKHALHSSSGKSCTPDFFSSFFLCAFRDCVGAAGKAARVCWDGTLRGTHTHTHTLSLWVTVEVPPQICVQWEEGWSGRPSLCVGQELELY